MDTTDTTTPPPDGLFGKQITEREMEVLREMAAGKTNGEISTALSISIKTVEAHRARLFRKMGAGNAPQAIVFAYAKGLIRPPLSGFTTEELAAELDKRKASGSPQP